MVDDGVFRTRNMALATVLCMNGFGYSLEMQANGRFVDFVFEYEEHESEKIDTVIAGFDSESLTVAPGAFADRLGEVRGKMYDFIKGRGRKTPSLRAN